MGVEPIYAVLQTASYPLGQGTSDFGALILPQVGGAVKSLDDEASLADLRVCIDSVDSIH